ncbi:DUF551 domain-containing protein [Enterobacter bugandensis]|uniref:DUF551 domain-containing protein n=1 Tax=Enterobacter bugandensis TaxID=881260 RepID=UPI0029D73931|nr:DUF551 domain-containing protein [Enterobacter bugandensis]MDX7621800.1 DUF551 domain-containing protein [Enterobacter bugandensis]
MDNRYEIAEQNGMSREFADWFFDNKKAGCGNVWFMMMAAMWEGWQGRAAMLQVAEPVTTAYKLPFEQWLSQQTGTIDVECGCVMTEVFFHWLRVAYEAGNSPVIPDGWVACSERMPKKNDKVLIFIDFTSEHVPPSIHDAEFTGATFRRGGATVNVFPLEDGYGVTHWQPLPSPPAK